MQRSCYVIERYNDRWSISVHGVRVLLCESKKAAVCAVRHASAALCNFNDAASNRPQAEAAQPENVEQGS